MSYELSNVAENARLDYNSQLAVDWALRPLFTVGETVFSLRCFI